MNEKTNYDLPTKARYILPSFGYTILIFANLFCYRNIDSVPVNLLSYAAFLFLIGIYISSGQRDVLIKKGLVDFIEKHSVTLWYSSKNKWLAVLYAGLICAISTILLIAKVYSEYQVYIDCLFFVFFVMEFYRGLNARLQNRFLIQLIQQSIKGGTHT